MDEASKQEIEASNKFYCEFLQGDERAGGWRTVCNEVLNAN
jgi:hypothetical protein